MHESSPLIPRGYPLRRFLVEAQFLRHRLPLSRRFSYPIGRIFSVRPIGIGNHSSQPACAASLFFVTRMDTSQTPISFPQKPRGTIGVPNPKANLSSGPQSPSISQRFSQFLARVRHERQRLSPFVPIVHIGSNDSGEERPPQQSAASAQIKAHCATIRSAAPQWDRDLPRGALESSHSPGP